MNDVNQETHLYRHFDKAGDLLYVGISINALARLKQHNEVSSWISSIARVDIERFSTRQAAIVAEREAILSEKPKFNVHHNGKKAGIISGKMLPAEVARIQSSRTEFFVRVYDPVYTIEGAARTLGLSKPEVIRLITACELGCVEYPPLRTGESPRIRITGWQLIDYLERLMKASIVVGAP